MKTITQSIAFAALMISGTAMADHAFPCSKAQFWITSMETVPAGAELHKDDHQINMANVLQQRTPGTRLAQASTDATPNI